MQVELERQSFSQISTNQNGHETDDGLECLEPAFHGAGSSGPHLAEIPNYSPTFRGVRTVAVLHLILYGICAVGHKVLISTARTRPSDVPYG